MDHIRLPIITLSLALLMGLLGYVGPVMAAPELTMNLTGVNGATAKVDNETVDVDPYSATIGTLKNISVFCDDFVHQSYLNSPWTAYVSTFDSLSNVRFVQGTAAQTLHDDDAAAWLVQQMHLAGPSGYVDYSIALWALFDPSLVGAQGWNSTSAGYLSTATSNSYAPEEFSNFLVYTPVCAGTACASTPQEFIAYPTPEPRSLALFGCGLLLILLIWRRRTALGC